jgi:HPr kinase/phosphorylase
MADSYSIDDLIAEHQQALQLSWLTHTRSGRLSAIPAMTHWIGEYTPEDFHAIALIHRNNLPVFEHALLHNALYLPAAIADTQPKLIIFSDDVDCKPGILASLQQRTIAVLHSPLPSKLILRALAYTLAEQDSHQIQHGVMLSLYGEGVLLTGNSGLGKSAIALELVSRGHQLVADDAPLLHRLPASEQVFAVCPPLLADFLEVRALGILNVCKLFGPQATMALMPIHIVIELVETFTAGEQQRLQAYSGRANILGVDIPYLQIPVTHAANLALIVETVTRNHVLYKDGYDASAILIQRQQQLLNKQTV